MEKLQLKNKILEKVLKLISHMPFKFHYILSYILFLFLYFFRYRSKVVYLNLNNSFPDKEKKEINQIARKFYLNFCDFIFETIKLITINEKNLNKKITLSGQSISQMQYWYHKKRHMIVLSGHVFNWEYCSIFPGFTDYKVLVTYQLLHNKFWENTIKAMRERFGGIAVDYRWTYREIKKHEAKNNLTLTWICGDQMPHFDSKVLTNIDFLNQDTFFYNGINSIAKKINAVVFFLELKKDTNKSYSGSFHLITDSPKNENDSFIITEYSKLLEKLIEQHPDNWLWSHKRWKNRPVAE
jgi:KDO2-lipid IV(A) lauroyltransferase